MLEQIAPEKPRQRKRLDWRPVVAVSVASGFGMAVLALVPLFDFWTVAYVLLIGPIICIAGLIAAAVCRSWTIAACVATLALVSFSLLKQEDPIRESGRWLLWSKVYKAQLLEQGTPSGDGLRHIEWDGWGFAGSDTVVYLVYDPHDSLARFVHNGSEGKLTSDLCAVWKIMRLERGWYSVVFYTDTAWAACD